MKIADVLDKAADLIEPKGRWAQGAYIRDGMGHLLIRAEPNACFCVLGALAEASGIRPYKPWDGHDADRAREPLAETIGITVHEIPEWNDAPERTQAEVVAKLREAAAKAREQGL